MKILITYILAFIIFIQLGACQQNNKQKNMHNEKFYWEEGTSCPLGYPVEVYRGGLESNTGNFTSLCNGLFTGIGGWGAVGHGMSSGVKTIPDHINTIWLSYAEDCMYQIDCDIDYNKMVEYFKKGYTSLDGYSKQRHENYDYIVTGFAPGGVVVLWLSGAGKRVEIGRYQGKKITIPQEQIDKLDSHERLLFDADHKKSVLEDKMVIPLAVQAANKNKPIPYGLWDTYRVRYMWRPAFTIQDSGKLGEVMFFYFNGEQEQLFDEWLAKNEFAARAISRKLIFSWSDKTGQNYQADIEFDEEEIFGTFKEVYGNNEVQQAELACRVNLTNSFVTVMLKTKDKEIALPKSKVIEIFKFK